MRKYTRLSPASRARAAGTWWRQNCADREVIALFVKKIQATLARVWGEDDTVAAAM